MQEIEILLLASKVGMPYPVTVAIPQFCPHDAPETLPGWCVPSILKGLVRMDGIPKGQGLGSH